MNILITLLLLFTFTLSDVGEVNNIQKQETNDISIIVVYDNNPYNEGLETGWGFSCFIEGPEKTILFDTGGDGYLFMKNLKKLGIDPKNVDMIIVEKQILNLIKRIIEMIKLEVGHQKSLKYFIDENIFDYLLSNFSLLNELNLFKFLLQVFLLNI